MLNRLWRFSLENTGFARFLEFQTDSKSRSKISKDYTGACGLASRRHAMLLSRYTENTTQKAHSEKKQFLAPGLSFVNTVMDTDEILIEIGSFGFFQKRNTLLLGLIIFVLTFQTVSMVFIGGEPTWRCTPNSTVCTRNGTFSADDDFYKERCNMSSEDWEFTTEFTSIVTEVGGFI